MRIRLPFLVAFFSLLLLAGYAGLSSLQLPNINDKALHAITFFAITLVFYWILDTSRRRNLNLTLIVCTGVLGIGSEFLQGVLPNGREFDVYDILANVVGSLTAVVGCSFYHTRMLERKRAKRGYGAVAQGEEGEEDIELGEGTGLGGEEVEGEQESGVIIPAQAVPDLSPAAKLEAEIDNWDENEPDEWDDDGPGGEEDTIVTPSASSAGDEVKVEKKRVD